MLAVLVETIWVIISQDIRKTLLLTICMLRHQTPIKGKGSLFTSKLYRVSSC